MSVTVRHFCPKPFNCKSLPSFNRLADPLNDMMVILYFFLTSMMHPVAIGVTIIEGLDAKT